MVLAHHGRRRGSFLHHHDGNEQLGIIMRGALDFRIGDPDDQTPHGARTPATSTSRRPVVWHGDSIFIGDDEYGEVWILDVFAPPRDRTPTAEHAS